MLLDARPQGTLNRAAIFSLDISDVERLTGLAALLSTRAMSWSLRLAHAISSRHTPEEMPDGMCMAPGVGWQCDPLKSRHPPLGVEHTTCCKAPQS